MPFPLKKNATILFFIVFSIAGLAQNFADKDYYLVDSLEIDKVSGSDKNLLDSCLTFFHQAEDDTNRLKAINSIVETSWDENVWPRYNLWVYNFVQDKLKGDPNEKVKRKLMLRLAGSINNIGFFESANGNISKALEFYKKSLKIQEELGSKEGIAASLNNIGTIYKKQGDIPNALEYYHKSLKIYKEINSIKGLGQALNNIGNVYIEQDDPNLALEYFHRGRNLYKKAGDERSEAFILDNIGYSYFKKKNYSKALDYYNQAITIRKTLDDIRGVATCYNNIALAYNSQGDQNKAMEYYLKSKTIYKELGYKLGLSTNSVHLAKALYNQGKKEIAKKYAKEGLSLAEKAGSPANIAGAALLLSKIYGDQGQGMKAFEMHKTYLTMRDSVKNQKNEKALIQQNARYQYQKEKAIDDAERDNLIAIEEKEKEKQTVISIATAVVLLLVLLFLVFVANRLKVTRKQKLLIEVQNKEIVDSITYAKRIQEAILPGIDNFNQIFPESFIYYRPKDIVAGDFYWMETVTTSRPFEEGLKAEEFIYFAVADCTGHGVPGAMVSVVCNNALNAAVREHKLRDPGKILDKTREIVASQFNKSKTTAIGNIRDGMDIALCMLNTRTNNVEFAGAYNPLWVLRNGSNTIEELKASRQAIGKVDKPKPFQTKKTQLNKGDQIYLFSDGFADQFGGEKGKKMMRNHFKKLLISIHSENLGTQKIQLDAHFEKWKGNLEQIDDVCVMGIRI